MRSDHKPRKVLFEEGNWSLLDATERRFNTGPREWQSVIKHHCPNTPGSPYWMLLEWVWSPTRCVYCKENMPEGIVCLFKLQNWEIIRP